MIDPRDREDILDLIYDTSVDAGAWPVLLERFTGLVGGHAAAFRSYDAVDEIGTVVTCQIDQMTLDARLREFADCNPLKSSLQTLNQIARGELESTWVPGRMRDVDWLPKEQFIRTDYYNDFYRAFDIHSDLSIGLTGYGTRWTGFDIYRPERHGPFDADELALCDALLPHLIRARKLAEKLSTSHAIGEGLSNVFDRSPHGLFLLSRDRRVLHANRAGYGLIAEGDGLCVIGGRLAAASTTAMQLLQRLVHQAGAPLGSARVGGSMGVATPCRALPLSVVVAPLGAEQAASFLSGPSVLVCVTDLEAGVSLPEQRLRGLFDLTLAETRVATALFEGLEPREVAARLDVSLPTVRSHLSHIFEKTGTASQAQLARLLMRVVGADLDG